MRGARSAGLGDGKRAYQSTRIEALMNEAEIKAGAVYTIQRIRIKGYGMIGNRTFLIITTEAGERIDGLYAAKLFKRA